MVGKLAIDRVVLASLSSTGSLTKDEVRAVLDSAVGVHYETLPGASQPGTAAAAPQKRTTWDPVTMNLAHDALRLIVRLLAHPEKEIGDALAFANIPAVLAVEVVGFAGVGERVRALALRYVLMYFVCLLGGCL